MYSCILRSEVFGFLLTCESYKESKKTCKSLTALTVVITEKFIGNDESGENEHMDIRTKAVNGQTNSYLNCQTKLLYLSIRIRTHEEKVAEWVRSVEFSCQS